MAPLGVAECDAQLCRSGTPFETEQLTIAGRNLRVWRHAPTTFRAFVTDRLTKWANNQFLSSPIADPEPYHEREGLTFGETHAAALRRAAVLREKFGVTIGTRVAIGGTNCTDWVVSYIAIHLLGAVPVLLNNCLHVDAQIHCLTLTQPKVVLADDKFSDQMGPHAQTLNANGVGPIWCWTSVDHLYTETGVSALAMLQASEAAVTDVLAGRGLEGLNPESDAIIFFTSGTTSLPKGVLVTQRQALHVIVTGKYTLARYALRMGAKPEDAIALAKTPRSDGVSLLSIPLFHAQGNLNWLLGAIDRGSKLVFLRRWSVPDAAAIMVKEKVTRIGGVPAIATAVLQSPLLPKDFVLESSGFGGASAPSRLAADLVRRWPGLVPSTGWGMTETCSTHTAIIGVDFLNAPKSAGHVVPIAEIRVVDPETRRDLPAGKEGLLLARGANIMKCYVNNPKATAEAIDADGWLDTGDIAFIDETGNMHITDRAKDMIIRGGENIPSVEVERAVCLDDRIAEACAVAVPDPILGERVGVAVSLAPGAKATPLSVAKLAWERLRYPARPDIVVVVDGDLPWNASQKILKTEVRKIVLAEWDKQGRKPMVDRTARL